MNQYISISDFVSVKTVLFFAAVTVGASLCAAVSVNPRTEPVTAHWTGASSGLWCDPANWEVEGLTEDDPGFHTVPGVVAVSADGVTVLSGNRNDKAVFDRATARAEVSCEGLECIGTVTFAGAEIPGFVFDGVLPLYTNGVFRIETSVVNVPSLDGLGIGAYCTSVRPVVLIENNASGCLEIDGNIGYAFYDPFIDPSKYGTIPSLTKTLKIAGGGSVHFHDRRASTVGDMIMDLTQSGDARLICSSPLNQLWRSIKVTRADATLQVIEIPAGGRFGYDAYGFDGAYFNSDTLVTGEGVFHLSTGNGRNSTMTVAENVGVVFECRLEALNGWAASPPNGSAFRKRGKGTMRLSCPTNAFEGIVEMNDSDSVGTIEIPRFGMAGAESPLGKSGGVCLGKGSTLRYTGAGETTDKRLYLQGGYDGFELAGGDLVFSSVNPVGVYSNYAGNAWIFQLFNNAGKGVGTFLHPITDAAPLTGDTEEDRAVKPVSVDVQTGTWRFSGAQEFTGFFRINNGSTVELLGSGNVASEVAMSGSSTLKIVGGTETAVNRTLSVANTGGAGSIVLTGKADVTLSSVSVTGGSLDIIADGENATVTVSGMTSENLPSGLTLNGLPARFDDDGKVVYGEGTKITGDRDLEVSGRDRYELTNPDNDYTGRTVLHGTDGAYIYALWPTSIPDYAKTVVYGNRITVPGFGLWSDSSILSLINSADLRTNAVIAVDTQCGDREIELSDTDIVSSSFGIGNDGANALTLTGDFTKKINFGAWDGMLVFSGQRNLSLGAGTVTGDYNADRYGTVVFDGVKGSISDDNEPIVVGGRRYACDTSAPDKYRGKLVVRDSVLTNGKPDNPSRQNIVLGGVGQSGTGVLQIEGEDTELTSVLTIGNAYASRTAVYQYGGTVVNWSAGAYDTAPERPVIGYNGSAYWELRDGTYKQLGRNIWASNTADCDAIFAQFGGEVLIAGREKGLKWGFGNGQTRNSAADRRLAPYPVYYQRGGSAVVSNIEWGVCWSESATSNGLAEVTLDGPTAVFEIDGTCTPLFSYNKGARTVFNLNDGGVLKTAHPIELAKSPRDPGYEWVMPRELLVNFNGGRICATGNLDLFGSDGSDKRATRVTVYERGAVFDTNGKDVTLTVPLTAPSGKGVVAVDFDTDELSGFGLVGAPGLFVHTENGGDGAAAFAEFDPVQGVVTNIRVTCPGFGYTSAPTVSVRYRNSQKKTAATAVLGDITGGGIVKAGAGTLTLAVANTYTGDTVVSNGVLRLGAEGALPGTVVKIRGGSLDVADGIAYPDGIVFDVSGLPYIEGEKYTVAANWTSETLPESVGIPEEDGWRLMRVGTTLRIKEQVGTIVIFR